MTKIFSSNQRRGFVTAGHKPLRVLAWGIALLSGKYTQGKSRLQDAATGAMCCVGVLCNIDPRVERHLITLRNSYPPLGVNFTAPNRVDNSTGYLEPYLMLGGDPDFPYDYDEDYPDFATANDERDVTFKQMGWWLIRTVPSIIIHQLRNA